MKQTILENKVPQGSRITGIVISDEDRVSTIQFRRIALSIEKRASLNRNREAERVPRSAMAGVGGERRYL